MDTNSLILQHTRTTQEVDILLTKIDEMLEALFKLNQSSFTQIFAGELPTTLSKLIQESFLKENLSFQKPQELNQFLTRLKELLQTTTVMTITIAFSPSDEAISAISAKTKELYGLGTVLEINVQESILAGAMVIYGGKYLDYSLQTKLSTLFKTRSKDIISILKQPKYSILNVQVSTKPQ